MSDSTTTAAEEIQQWMATRKARVKRVAQAIENAIVVECHTYATYDLDYTAAAEAAIREVKNDSK